MFRILSPLLRLSPFSPSCAMTRPRCLLFMFPPSLFSHDYWHPRVLQFRQVWFKCWKTSEWILSRCPSNGIRGSRKPPDQRQRSISLSLQTDLAVQSSSCRGLGNHSNHLERTVCSHPTASIISQIYVKPFFLFFFPLSLKAPGFIIISLMAKQPQCFMKINLDCQLFVYFSFFGDGGTRMHF